MITLLNQGHDRSSKNDRGVILTGALLCLVITVTVEFFSKLPDFWQALVLPTCFGDQKLFGSKGTPYSQLQRWVEKQ